MFDLASLVDRFRHVPSEIHAEADKHAKVEEVLRQAANDLVSLVPQAQEAHQIVGALEAVGTLVHTVIDRQAAVAQTGVVRTNDKVSSAESGGVESAAPAAPAVSGEATAVQAGAAPEVATPPAPPAAPAAPVPVPPTQEAAAASTAASPPAPTETPAAPDVPAGVALPNPVADVATATEVKPAPPA